MFFYIFTAKFPYACSEQIQKEFENCAIMFLPGLKSRCLMSREGNGKSKEQKNRNKNNNEQFNTCFADVTTCIFIAILPLQ